MDIQVKKNSLNNIKAIYRNVVREHYILKCKDQKLLKKLHSKAQNDLIISQPNYFPFDLNSPNFRKSNYQNNKSIVNGYFEQYNYFPWNNDSKEIFTGLHNYLKLFFDIANQFTIEKKGLKYTDLTGLSTKNFYTNEFFLRICYQKFPKKLGYLSIHRDPIGNHQLSAPIVNLTSKKEFGLYYILKDEKINAQSLLSYGDAIYVDQSRLHAVEHDLFTPEGTEHFLIVVHRYHSDKKFLKSTTK